MEGKKGGGEEGCWGCTSFLGKVDGAVVGVAAGVEEGGKPGEELDSLARKNWIKRKVLRLASSMLRCLAAILEGAHLY